MTSTCKLLVLLLCLCVLASEASQKRIIKIGRWQCPQSVIGSKGIVAINRVRWVFFPGAIFLASDQQSIISFHSAVHRENVHSRRFELQPIVRNVTEWDSFVTEKIGMMPELDSATQCPPILRHHHHHKHQERQRSRRFSVVHSFSDSETSHLGFVVNSRRTVNSKSQWVYPYIASS